ncbi:acetolactate synthase small subunit [Ileibacterium valens]|uniref:Acetolactate synthase small subunit n=2 Tax=Ileibacterium valens TaxID=1862668 RepID=A0A1U7ND42_9FIRM|nr:acetolactate synthase small subunit [Ileibacterium valens]OLU36772.1 acetolactate synthase small subunit [Ileibacterium valens]OLU39034.1 acetolactate synthase small subunit [Erysipelotrichaceae bacterium NYU-BL-F16]OLU41266.1 acetolactate synthase small subunit [Erysipelotrichaceae bacterium NYU-BL-E8]
MEHFEIACLVRNSAGVLTRVSSMFTRRGFNINSLAVGPTEDPALSRITISVNGDENIRSQCIKQLRKLYDVKDVKEMISEERVGRELALIKLKNLPETRSDIVSAVDIFRCKIIDFSPSTLCVEITGEPSKINAFITVVEPYGILEMCRSGLVALQRGCSYLNEDIDFRTANNEARQ